MEPTDHRGPGAHVEDGHPELANALKGERRRAIASRNWLESGMALIGMGMAAVIAAAVVLALLRAVI